MAITSSPLELHDRAGTLFFSGSRYPFQALQYSRLSRQVFPHTLHVPCKRPFHIRYRLPLRQYLFPFWRKRNISYYFHSPPLAINPSLINRSLLTAWVDSTFSPNICRISFASSFNLILEQVSPLVIPLTIATTVPSVSGIFGLIFFVLIPAFAKSSKSIGYSQAITAGIFIYFNIFFVFESIWEFTLPILSNTILCLAICSISLTVQPKFAP